MVIYAASNCLTLLYYLWRWCFWMIISTLLASKYFFRMTVHVKGHELSKFFCDLIFTWVCSCPTPHGEFARSPDSKTFLVMPCSSHVVTTSCGISALPAVFLLLFNYSCAFKSAFKYVFSVRSLTLCCVSLNPMFTRLQCLIPQSVAPVIHNISSSSLCTAWLPTNVWFTV